MCGMPHFCVTGFEMTENNTQNNRIIREPEMLKLAGNLSRSTLLRWEKQGKFPKRRKLGSWLVGWLESDFSAWLEGGAKMPLPHPPESQ